MYYRLKTSWVPVKETQTKEIPQDSIWLDPQIERLVRVNREPSHPGDALNEFDELNVTLAISFLGKGV